MLAALSGILGVLVPVFLVIGVGFVAVRSRYIDPEALQALGTFALRIALPALIFDALTRAPLGETMDRGYLVAYGAGTLAVFALGVVAARRAGRPLDQSAIFGLGMSGSNSGYMGYPIAALVIGPAAGPILAQNMLVENLLLLPMALVLAETSERGGSSLGGVLRDIALSLARNPLLIALALGLAVAGLGLSPPGRSPARSRCSAGWRRRWRCSSWAARWRAFAAAAATPAPSPRSSRASSCCIRSPS